MITALINGRILTTSGWLDGHAVLVQEGSIRAIMPTEDVPPTAKTTDLGGHMLLPGFTDIQVNGGGGVLFNDQPDVDGIKTIMAAHRRYGTTAMLPTIISDDLTKITQAIKAVDAAISEGVPGILGIHIEGPFLSPIKKGAHDAGKFRTLDEAAIQILSSLKGGVTLLTLAPEETTPDMIKKLVATGVIVAAGHTNATYEQMHAGLKAGISGFTHLYNAMSQLTAREPGVVGAALSDKASYAGIIADGYHVAPPSIKAAVNAKGRDHMMLVTDAMPCVGSAENSFTLAGNLVQVSGGKCTLKDGTLAGSSLNMAQAVRNTSDWLDLPLEEAANMASGVPAAFLGLSQMLGYITPGARANFVLLDTQRNVQQTWIHGVCGG